MGGFACFACARGSALFGPVGWFLRLDRLTGAHLLYDEPVTRGVTRLSTEQRWAQLLCQACMDRYLRHALWSILRAPPHHLVYSVHNQTNMYARGSKHHRLYLYSATNIQTFSDLFRLVPLRASHSFHLISAKQIFLTSDSTNHALCTSVHV